MPFRFPIFLTLLLVFTTFVSAQQDDEDIQSWNELQITVPVAKKVDLTISTTARIGNNVSQFRDGRFGIGMIFKPTKSFALAPSYIAIVARNNAGRFHDEHRLSFKGIYKFPVKGFGLSHKSTYEFRIRTSGNLWQYRPSLTFEKPLPKKLLDKSKLFVTNEFFYMSATKKFSRNRFSVGVSRVIDKRLTLDVYYLRQNDGYAHPGDLNVLGTTWKVHF